jgi:hypothetical protein
VSRDDELDQLLRSCDRVSVPAGSAMFTARVLGSLPTPLRGTGLTPRTRALVLAAFHVGAVLLSWAVLWAFAPESLAAVVDRAHALIDGSEAVGPIAGLDLADVLGAAAVALALALAAAVALRARPTHTPTA